MMNDLISRQAALRAFEAYDGSALDKLSLEEFDALKMTIWSVPTAEKKGKWVDGQCSNCGCDVPAYIIDWKWQKDIDANYCPNCGARMEDEHMANLREYAQDFGVSIEQAEENLRKGDN